ncbi:MAG: DNA repair protein RecN [Clostridia bacterium]|nr:DNA repair protein RecN [Clostridia bacterium]
MLLSLHIENIAIIRRLDIDFEQGFTALTGETGAGKSILIDSIGFLLGERVQRELLRHGAEKAMVSGLFGSFSESELSFFETLGIATDEDGTLLLERSMGSDGRSQCRINGRMVNLSLLRELASSLIHIHGQSDTALFAERLYALRTLDDYGTPHALLKEYEMAYKEFAAAKRALNEHSARESERLRLEDTLKRQIAEIRKASPRIGEEEQLFEKKNRLKNAERVSKLANFSYQALKGSEKASALVLLERVRQSFVQLQEMIPSLADSIESLDACISSIDDLAETVLVYAEEGGDDPTEQLNRLESRLDVLYHLSKRYGGSVEACLAFLEKAEKDLTELENFEDRRKELEKAVADAFALASQKALELHKIREVSAAELGKRLEETLKILDLPSIALTVSVKLRCENDELMCEEHGADDVSFLFSSSGEQQESILKIASGGEMSRVMLALRDVMAEKSGVKTAIYDEIDTGVSGKTARKIGLKMRSAAKRGQVFCVTHSAQVASLADRHLLIRKENIDGRPETAVTLLQGEERTEEIARILGGIRVTEAQRAAAFEMLTNREE